VQKLNSGVNLKKKMDFVQKRTVSRQKGQFLRPKWQKLILQPNEQLYFQMVLNFMLVKDEAKTCRTNWGSLTT
jgi:hypothetical protein